MAEIPVKPVKSSNVSHVGYDAPSKTMAVRFKGSGQTYHFTGVGQEDHDKLLGEGVEGHSIGGHFGKHIKGKFPFSKVG